MRQFPPSPLPIIRGSGENPYLPSRRIIRHRPQVSHEASPCVVQKESLFRDATRECRIYWKPAFPSFCKSQSSALYTLSPIQTVGTRACRATFQYTRMPILASLARGIDPRPETAVGEVKHPPSEEGKIYFLHACLL